jgi:5'-methylthioadenosine phosphorylase
LEKTAKLAVIGGSGFEHFFEDGEQVHVGTPYGIAVLLIGKIGGFQAAFIPRHGPGHLIPPHMINYRANIWALHEVGVERIIAVNAVGAINRDFKPCDFVVPHDFVDFTKARSSTFYDEAPVTHIDMSKPYCPELRQLLIEALRRSEKRTWESAVFLTTEGPRYETPAEIEMFRRLGCDVVGMTGVPEVVLARELKMCYASVCYVSNLAAGLQGRLSTSEVADVSKLVAKKLEQALIETVKVLPLSREKCRCCHALEDARFM